jgi:hypothetical protein
MDEWWDRCDSSFKLKIQAFVFFALLGLLVAGVLWAHQKSERQAWLEAGSKGAQAEGVQGREGLMRAVSDASLRQPEN